MILVLALLALLATDVPADDRAAYRAAADAAGRDPDAHVQLALWCEARGMEAERLGHLAQALLADPEHATARGMMGQVRDRRGRWVRADDAGDGRAHAEARSEYERRRAKLGGEGQADDHWSLALWCEQNGLEAEAQAHLTLVTRLDPGRDAAWKRLGFKKIDGRWTTDARASEERAERRAQEQADRSWGAKLAKLRSQLGDPRKRAAAEAALAEIRDPRAVGAVLRTFAGGGAEDQRIAAQVLAQINDVPASLALARLAVFASAGEGRRAAAEALAWRDPREYVGPLIGLVREPIRYDSRPVGGPGRPGELIVSLGEKTVRRVYEAPHPGTLVRPGDRVAGFDAYGLPVVRRVVGQRTERIQRSQEGIGTMGELNSVLGFPDVPDLTVLAEALARSPLGAEGERVARQAMANLQRGRDDPMNVRAPGGMSVAWWEVTRSVVATLPVGQIAREARRAAMTAEAQLRADIESIEQTNAAIEQSNARVLPLLREATERDFGPDPTAWARWWTDFQGYAFREASTTPTTITEVVRPDFQPPPVALGLGPVIALRGGHSCFAAGTPVRTLEGPRPIESIRVGDVVLSQDPSTGRLDYRPVVATFHNPPDRTLRLRFAGGEEVVATPIHRFWVGGRGWVMARDLTAGEAIRGVGGLVRVESIEPDAIQPVFNLEVAEATSFFVGKAGLLVHDNSLVRPVAEPFDRPAALVASGEGAE